MKTISKLFTAAFLVFIITDGFSQIPNSGFENWTSSGNYMNPNSWYTTNSTSSSGFYPVSRDTSHYPATVGNYSLRIESKPSLLPGGEALGASSTGNGFNLTPDFTITGHPNSLTGYYKYAPLNGDTMHILIALFNNSTLVAVGMFQSTAPAPTWTSFNIPISSYATANKAKIYLGAYDVSGPPPQYVPYGNSVLNIDNMNFDSLISDVPSYNDEINKVLAYPNPCNRMLTVVLKDGLEKGMLRIKNVLGQEIFSTSFTGAGTLNIELEEKPGIYFLIVESDAVKPTVIKVIRE